MGFHWPDNFRTVPLLEKIEGRKCYFKGGETQDVDAIILCNSAPRPPRCLPPFLSPQAYRLRCSRLKCSHFK